MTDRSARRSFLPERADQVTVRRTNVAVTLRSLRDAGPRSRARLAEDTGLNKTTISSVIAELAERGLVATRGVHRAGAAGRPGVVVEVDGRHVYGIGIELNVDYIAVLALDLRGSVLFERRLPIDVPRLGPGRTLDEITTMVNEAIGVADRQGGTDPVGITVAIPGLVETNPGVLIFAPNLGWRDFRLVSELSRRLGNPSYRIRMDNDANLSAIGEWAFGVAAGTADLVYLTGEVGVGAGVVVDGQLLRGAEGFGGEVGHMPLEPGGQVCGCGRRGCWETMVGLGALLRLAASPRDDVRDPSLDLEERLKEIVRRAEANDSRTLSALEQIGAGLGVGASILINLFNPKVLVLGGYFARVGPYILEPMVAELQSRVIAPGMGGCRVELSQLGFTAAVRGGAQVALEPVLDDPTTVRPPRRKGASGGVA
jgi:Transcriptional regulator/sugar kinase